MASKKKIARTAPEWIGGLVSLPAYVTGEGEPYRPEILLWAIPDGPVLGMTMAKPGELLPRAADHFRDTMRAPMVGGAHVPPRVRVASPELASALREAIDSHTEIVCAPTPELDHVVEGMREHFSKGGARRGEESYLTEGIDACAVASFFHAAAALFRAKPWSIVPDDGHILSVTCEALGVRDAVLSVIGQMGESFGFIVFASTADYEAYADTAGSAMEVDEMPVNVPAHFALSFERGAETRPALRKEIQAHGWEVAGPNAYPWVVYVDEDIVGRPPTARELTVVDAIARALAELASESELLARAWERGKTFSRTRTVTTHAGPIEITLRAPYEVADPTRNESAPHDLLGEVAALEDEDEIDEERRVELEGTLFRQFADSPEGKELGEISWCDLVATYAANYFDTTIASLTAADLREIVFEIFPRKVSVDASEAGAIVEELRAFFAFLKREHGFTQADACARVLGDGAVKRLQSALSDPQKFGMAKSIMMTGRDAGFDVSSEEGARAWMRQIKGKPLPRSISIPSLAIGESRHAEGPGDKRGKKNRRKAQRKARKKSR